MKHSQNAIKFCLSVTQKHLKEKFAHAAFNIKQDCEELS